MSIHHDLYHTIALLQTPLVGDKTARTLIAYCGSAKAVFEASKKELAHINGIGLTTAEHIKAFNNWAVAEAELAFLEKHKISAHLYHEANYPTRLKNFDDSPTVLYQKGDWNANKQARIVGIVGTRNPTNYGREFTERLVEKLKPYQVTVISGLAYGIDVTAHRASLEHQIPTVGVLAHGLSRVYPHAHGKTAERMWQEGGALITEFPSYTTPERENFPRRNRIVAGLCDALIVAETARSGGSMITAKIANNYNKDVFALPGRMNDACSVGCNLLIKSHQAALIESVSDLAYVMSWELTESKKNAPQAELFVDLSDEEQAVLGHLRESENKELPIDTLTFQSKIPASKLAAILLGMEFRGIIQSLPGKRYAAR